MSDEELRALERALRAGGAPEARIRYADALERIGRVDDALAVLLEAREDSSVRARIGRLTVSDHPSIDGAPRVLWTHRWDGSSDERFHGRSYDTTDVARSRHYHSLRAYPLSFVVELHSRDETTSFWYEGGAMGGESVSVEEQHLASAHDPETGRLQASVRTGEPGTLLCVRGDVLLVGHPTFLETSDLFARGSTGEWWKHRTLRSTSYETFRLRALAGAGAILSRDAETATLWLERLPDPRGEPLPAEPVPAVTGATIDFVKVGGALAVVGTTTASGERRLHVVDLERGARIHEAPAEKSLHASRVLVDTAGFVVTGANHVACHDRSGAVLWRKDLLGAQLRGLARSAVLLEVGGEWLLVDRAQDHPRRIAGVAGARAWALSSDRVYLGVESEVVAHDLSGEVAWRFTSPEPGPVTGLAALPGRLIVLAGATAYGLGGAPLPAASLR